MTKKYKLKSGKHQFAPGSHAVHDNNSLTDEEAAWYLERYPHIAALFERPADTHGPEVICPKAKKLRKSEPGGSVK